MKAECLINKAPITAKLKNRARHNPLKLIQPRTPPSRNKIAGVNRATMMPALRWSMILYGVVRAKVKQNPNDAKRPSQAAYLRYRSEEHTSELQSRFGI